MYLEEKRNWNEIVSRYKQAGLLALVSLFFFLIIGYFGLLNWKFSAYESEVRLAMVLILWTNIILSIHYQKYKRKVKSNENDADKYLFNVVIIISLFLAFYMRTTHVSTIVVCYLLLTNAIYVVKVLFKVLKMRTEAKL